MESMRENRTVVLEMARSMLQEKGLSTEFWVRVVPTSVYLLNPSPTNAVKNTTPYQKFCGVSQNHLQVI